jgi:hypothetical protein
MIRTPVPNLKSVRRQKEAEGWSDMTPLYLACTQAVRRTRTNASIYSDVNATWGHNGNQDVCNAPCSCTSARGLNTGNGVRFWERGNGCCIQKQGSFIPCLHREWVPCVSVVLSSGTRPRERCVCVCKPENLTSEREMLLAKNAKCVKATLHTFCTVIHMVRHT